MRGIQRRLDTVFEGSKDLTVIKNYPEAEEMARFWLGNESKRQACVHAMRERVLARYARNGDTPHADRYLPLIHPRTSYFASRTLYFVTSQTAMLRKIAEFFLLLGATILATYYLPEIAKTPFYILLLIAYFRSSNEAIRLALFLTTADGFWGFFNPYDVVVKVIAGLPPIEVEQIYIALTVIKASGRKVPGPYFHRNMMWMLGGYVAFLVLQGYSFGLSPQLNVQFRLVKFLLPLAMFYSIPRLFRTEEDFRDIFVYVFPMAFLALFAQVFTITTSLTPSQFSAVYKNAV